MLDIGCGPGRHTVYLAARGFEVTATDNSPSAIELCRENLSKFNLQAKLVECDMAKLPFAPTSFDGAISTKVIHHAKLGIIRQVIANITDLLAKDGYFVWITLSSRDSERQGEGAVEIEPNTWIYMNHREGPIPHHYSSLQEVQDLLKSYEFIKLEEVERASPAIEKIYKVYNLHILARKVETT